MIRATPAHAAVMAALHAAAFPPAERWGADALSLQLALPGVAGWVAGPDGFVLFRVAGDEAEILTLAVHPDRRRRGIGCALLAAALGSAREAGAAAMFLEVADTNGAAVALYAGAGFTQVGLRPRYYAGGAAARVMRAGLSAGAPAPR